MAEATPSSTLSVGDRVVYPNQGVCRVSGIEVKEVAGQRLTFVTMAREEDGARVMVPLEKVQKIGIRHLANREDVDRVFAFLRSESDKADLDWKQRARTNQDRMTQGGLLGLAEVVKALQVLSELRPLPTKERELYDNARHLLVTEVAAGLSVSEVDAEDTIDLVLFPPGKERPKRTAAEFKPTPGEGEEEELGDLDSELLTMGGEELPPEPLPEDSESTEVIGRPLGEESAEENTVDEEVTQPAASAAGAPAKRKRGRPPKPKPAVDPNAPPPAPKKRGRPPKPKPAVDPNAPPPAPKKRGRPPKSASGEKKSK